MSCPTGKEEEVARCRRKDRKSVAEVQGRGKKRNCCRSRRRRRRRGNLEGKGDLCGGVLQRHPGG